MLLSVSITFVAFCLLSGSVYLVNDIVDLERDKAHAKKCKRPIACGAVSPSHAGILAAMILVLALAASAWVNLGVLAAAVAYVLLQVLYTFWLKHQVLLDVFAIAAGFVLRTLAGALAIGLALSPWLYAAVTLLALFLGFGKRRHELLLLDEEAFSHRPALKHYSAPLLDALLSSVTAATIVTYAIYSFSSETAQESVGLFLTVPFVMYGLFRYLYLIYARNLGGNPEEILLTDAPLITAIVLWLGMVVVSLYVL